MHAYGKAIDLNPVENPYVSGNVSPEKGAKYADRCCHRAIIHAGDKVVRAFRVGGLGVGRLLVRGDQGLPALLDQRQLANAELLEEPGARVRLGLRVQVVLGVVHLQFLRVARRRERLLRVLGLGRVSSSPAWRKSALVAACGR